MANEVTGDLLGEWAGLGAVDDNMQWVGIHYGKE